MTLKVRRIENARQEHHLRIRYDRGVEELRRHIRVINAETSLRTLRAKIGRNLFPRRTHPVSTAAVAGSDLRQAA